MSRSVIRGLTLMLALLFLGALWLSRSYPTIQYVDVRGAEHYDAEALARAANLYQGRPLLWVSQRDVHTLAAAPWIDKVRLVRHFPSSISLMVWEKEPVAVYYPKDYHHGDGESTGAQPVGYTLAGEVLPDIRPAEMVGLTKIEGWGTKRVDEALRLLRLLHTEQPLVINYTPQGFDVHFASITLHTESVTLLQTHWQAFAAALQESKTLLASADVDAESSRQPRQHIVVYPWGVSTGVSMGERVQVHLLEQQSMNIYDNFVKNHIFSTFRIEKTFENIFLASSTVRMNRQYDTQIWASILLADFSLGVAS